MKTGGGSKVWFRGWVRYYVASGSLWPESMERNCVDLIGV